jgi:hypothetical protein
MSKFPACNGNCSQGREVCDCDGSCNPWADRAFAVVLGVIAFCGIAAYFGVLVP